VITVAATLPTTAPRQHDLIDLIDGLRAEKPEAVEQFINICRQHIVDYARRRGSAEPEGIADLTVVDVMGKVNQLEFQDSRQVWGYLFTVARFKIVNEQRADGRNLTEPLTGAAIDQSTWGVEDGIIDRLLIEDTLAQLTPEQAEILTLRFIDDLTIVQTAEKTGRTVTAVKALQRRALRSSASILAAVVLAIIGYVAWVQLQDDTNTVRTSDPAVQRTDTSLGDDQRTNTDGTEQQLGNPDGSGGLTDGDEQRSSDRFGEAGLTEADGDSSPGEPVATDGQGQTVNTDSPGDAPTADGGSAPAAIDADGQAPQPDEQAGSSDAAAANQQPVPEQQPATTQPATTVQQPPAEQPAATVPVAATAPAGDFDGDGRLNSVDIDDDNDGLTDAREQTAGTNPFNSDTDGDGLSDWRELMIIGSSPLNADTDNDGVADGVEVANGTNPLGRTGDVGAETAAPPPSNTNPTTTTAAPQATTTSLVQQPTTTTPQTAQTNTTQQAAVPNTARLVGAGQLIEHRPDVRSGSGGPETYRIELDAPADTDTVFVINTNDITANRTSDARAPLQYVGYGWADTVLSADHVNQDPWDYTVSKDGERVTGQFTLVVRAGSTISEDSFVIDAWAEFTWYGPEPEQADAAFEDLERFRLDIIRAEGTGQDYTLVDREIQIYDDRSLYAFDGSI
jgi:RNA polymerase sigma factor (sigma-70 family)